MIDELEWERTRQLERDEGRTEGLREGKQAEKRETAARMLERGFSAQEVAALTDLPLTEVEALVK